MTYSRGDIVVIPFMFADKAVTKRRPAIIVSSEAYHASRQEVIVAAVTSNLRRGVMVGDHALKEWQAAGLPKPSVATGILRTAKQAMIIRKLGSLSSGDLSALGGALSRALDL